MCGILVYHIGLLDPEDTESAQAAISNRGPDFYSAVEKDGISFESSVLSLRKPFTGQPLSGDGYVFSYNGQIYDLPEGVNDTKLACTICRKLDFKSLLMLEGEFAFVYYSDRTIWFGRDFFGRRSLVFYQDESGKIIISSVAANNAPYIECDGGGIVYKYSLDKKYVEKIQLDIKTIIVNPCAAQMNDDLTDVQLLNALKNAVMKRTVRPESEKGISIMFSGGLDCTIIASLLDDVLPPSAIITLLNVAFENKRTGTLYDTPDRVLARRSLTELKSRSKVPDRFQLVELNVPYQTYVDAKREVIDLMRPSFTVMDLSIAIAFFFTCQPQPNHTFTPRILLSGLGADELFAGYSRHASAARLGGLELANELAIDLMRLPHRNLGRDDRVCACWGREVRYPFLDNEVVRFATSLPTTCKSDGENTKIILRKVALLLNLNGVANEKKRAIQFGARSAKIDPGSGKSKGDHMLDS